MYQQQITSRNLKNEMIESEEILSDLEIRLSTENSRENLLEEFDDLGIRNNIYYLEKEMDSDE